MFVQSSISIGTVWKNTVFLSDRFPCSSSVLILQQRFMNDVILFILYLRTRTQTYVHDLSLTTSRIRIHHTRRPGEGKSFFFPISKWNGREADIDRRYKATAWFSPSVPL